ncbi:MAG: ATP-dependent DNA helicase RecG, partial [Vulcanimicrobiaceae bacterium]
MCAYSVAVRIQELKDVGPKTATALLSLGIETALDLLQTFPFRYEDLRFATPTSQAKIGDGEQNFVGTVVSVNERRVRDLEIVDARITDDHGMLTAKWIGRRRYILGRLQAGMRIFVRGRFEAQKIGAPALNVTQWRVLGDGEEYRGALVPIYRASKDITTRKIHNVITRNFRTLLDLAGDDSLPAALAKELGYPSLADAYAQVHAPDSPEDAARARERFVFAEFLIMALAAELRRRQREHEHDAQMMPGSDALLAEFEASLPFALTTAQRRVIGELWADQARDIPMNRMLQGDVGSGKTLVAAAAIVLAARNGVQSALMAPTEVLAAQHASKLAPLLLPLGITVEAVFGSQGAKSRNAATQRIASGEALLAVGTHALITDGVDFARLGLVVIDEQHRFGVAQRAKLRSKGGSPHTLHMTATPIPRTLAQTYNADLDISTIDELPPGRTPIETFVVRLSRMDRVERFIRANVARGQQAYIVAPAIEESDAGLSSAVEVAERLSTKSLADLRVGLLHGKLNAKEKD